MKRIAVLASGRGSNFQAVLDQVSDGTIQAKIVRLITDKTDAYAIERARFAGIPVTVTEFRSFPEREAYNEALSDAMDEAEADLFVLAGYMRILPDQIIKKFRNRMINIHPSLLPNFSGLHAQRQAVEYGVKVAGCTVHFVDEGTDTGPIIIQRVVPVLEGDDEDNLTSRILKEEHIAMPEAVKLFCEDRLVLDGRHVRILP